MVHFIPIRMVHFNPIRVAHFIPLKVVHLFPIQVAHLFRYYQVRPWGLTDRAMQSIEDVTNPLLNSINEKCARIRKVFASMLDRSIAEQYYIKGERGRVKKISLPRELVVWE